MAKYKCTICGYVHEGDAAPAQCPQCKQPADKFVLVEEPKKDGPVAPAPKKKGIDTNSNAYTIIYSCVVVVIVAFLLAFCYTALKPISDVNVALDKKKQILLSLNVKCEKSEIEGKYNEIVKETYVLDAANNKLAGKDAFKVDTKELGKDCLPVYQCEVNGETKYVLPLKGRGLWGGLWGYISVNSDKNTVYGVYFDHESETAGLGALIKEEKFQIQFVKDGKGRTKQVRNAKGDISLHVFKAGKAGDTDRSNYVDAVTGATLTSNGVNDMLVECLGWYDKFLKQ